MRKNIVEFPEGWHELTSDQAKDVFDAHLLHIADELSERDMRVLLICKWLKLGNKFHYKRIVAKKTNNLNELHHIDAQVFRISETMDWLYKVDEVERRVKKKMRKVKIKTLGWDGLDNFFPAVKTEQGIFYAPDPFYRIPAQQFLDAFNSFRSYYERKNEEDLNRFFAQLYLPVRSDLERVKTSPQFDGRRCEEYNPHTTELHESYLKHVPVSIKYGALLWFMNWDRYLKTQEIEIEGNVLNLSSLFKGGDNTGESLGLTGILLSIAEEGVFGPLDKVQKRPILDIYVKLYNTHLLIKNASK